MSSRYTGRFAPTPSGPLHFGSIVTALASYLDARKHSGRWLLRIDDLDTPRVRPGAADSILNTLDQLGLHWDGEVVYQNDRREAYQQAIEQLHQHGLLYRCDCPRRETRGKPYPGTCRDRLVPLCNQAALRLRTGHTAAGITDLIQGKYRRDINAESGDFIVLRADGLHAYPLAVVVDDDWQGVTHIIRGADLLETTPEQVWLQTLLGLPHPVYGHVPVVLGQDGKKLSKSDAALEALLGTDPSAVLVKALQFLGQPVAKELSGAVPDDIIGQALTQWELARVPRYKGIPY